MARQAAQTLAEKIIARAAGCNAVHPGEFATCRVDLAMMHDSGGPRRVAPILECLGIGVWDANKVVVMTDHFMPAIDAESAQILDLTRRWVAEHGIRHFYDMQRICHVVLPEYGHLRPSMFVDGGDSHSPTGGAFGCFMFGLGDTDMAAVLVTGETWIEVPGNRRSRRCTSSASSLWSPCPSRVSSTTMLSTSASRLRSVPRLGASPLAIASPSMPRSASFTTSRAGRPMIMSYCPRTSRRW
jgi:hypothetical protein